MRAIACAVSASIVLLSGCAPLDARKDAKYLDKVYAADRPVVRPGRSISSFSDSLMCMDRMFRNSHMLTVLITSKQLPDYSGRVAVAAKEMVVTALSQMSRVSSAFRYVDYEVDIARQDTVQNLTTILLNNNQIQLQRPALYVSGAVSFMDQNVLRNNVDIGTSASRLETGYSANRSGAVLGMELHLGDFRTRTIIPGLDSANEVVIGNGSQGLDLSGRIGTYGVQFSVGRDYAQGSGPAVRTLVELGMIELLGKWSRLPYWQCLTLDQTHPDFQRQLRDWYEEGEAGIHQELVRQSLISKGLSAAGRPGLHRRQPAVARGHRALPGRQRHGGQRRGGLQHLRTRTARLRGRGRRWAHHAHWLEHQERSAGHHRLRERGRGHGRLPLRRPRARPQAGPVGGEHHAHPHLLRDG